MSSSHPTETASRRPPRERQRRSSPSDASSQPSLQGANILVVEDDLASNKLLNLLLTDAGASVTAVSSAEAALEVLETSSPALIVLDLILPRMAGLVLVEQVKADPKTRDIVILAVSALNGPEVERVALASGCAAYLRKPVDTATFARLVAMHLGDES